MSLSLQSTNGVRIAVLDGAVDNSSGSDLVTTVKSSVEKGATIILDCTLVPSMDVAGFRHLLALHRWSQIGNGRLILAGMGPEAWALIVENHCENTFESSPSVAAAMQSVGVAGDELDGASSASQAAEEDYSMMDIPPPPLPEGDSGIFSRGQGGTGSWMASGDGGGASSDWSTSPSPASAAGDDGWETFGKRPSNTLGDEEGAHHPKSRTPLYIAIAAAALVLIVGGLWLKSYLAPPVITVDQPSISTDEGKSLPNVMVTVENGSLDIDAIQLPSGVVLVEEGEQDGNWVYTLGGLAKEPGKFQVELKAKRGEREALPIEVAIEIKEVKKVEWLFSSSLPLQEKKPINKLEYASVVKAAKSVRLLWSGEDPKGLKVERVAGANSTWQLEGTPEISGSFDAEFHAINESDQEETKTFKIHVKAAPAPPPPPIPPDTPSALVTQAGSPAPAVSPNQTVPPKNTAQQITPPAVEDAPEEADATIVDTGMRTILMKRIELANDHFDATEKYILRDTVGKLKDARQLGIIEFESGSAKASPAQVAKIKDVLSRPSIKKLLAHEDCQILIVGYASKSGNHAYNIKLSRSRARHVNDFMRREIGRDADLCGDYGPTDIISDDSAGNQIVEVYAGILEVDKANQDIADKFKNDFNKNHGGR